MALMFELTPDGWIFSASVNCVCLSERYRIQSDSFEDMWLVVKELVQRFDQHFAKLGIKDFKKGFTGPLPLQEYFLSLDHHFQVQTHPNTSCVKVRHKERNRIFVFVWCNGKLPQRSETFVSLCVLATCQCSTISGSAVRASSPVQSHPAPSADPIQRQNPSTSAEPGHTPGCHLHPG